MPRALAHRNWLFPGLFGFSVLAMLILCIYTWMSMMSDIRSDRRHHLQLTSNSVRSVLSNQESMLELVGWQLLDDFNLDSFDDVPFTESVATRLLDRLLTLNPAVAGFGLADTEGHMRYVTSDMAGRSLPNLATQGVSHFSFAEAINARRMVLGRTYYMPALLQQLVPIRVALRNSQGQAVAVMTAGLKLSGANAFLSDDLYWGNASGTLLIRRSDRYLQYELAGGEWPVWGYQTPVDTDFMDAITRSNPTNDTSFSVPVNQVSVDHRPPEGAGPDQLFTATFAGETVIGLSMYLPEYDLWLVSAIKRSELVNRYLSTIAGYLLVFAVLQLILYLGVTAAQRVEREKNGALLHQATHDPLTQLANRAYVFSRMHRWLQRGEPFCVLYIDMDHFKNINDHFGHEFGDKVLMEVADRLLDSIPTNALAARQGGDEFLALVHCEQHGCEEVQQIANTILRRLAEMYYINKVPVELGVSIGLARYPQHGDQVDDLLRASDIAMYEAKKHRNCLREYTYDMQIEHQNMLDMEQQLRHGLARDEFFVVLQPQLDSSGRLHGFEALLRWQSQALGLVSPERFIPIAESIGLMPRLGDFVLQQALQLVREIQETVPSYFRMSINISVRQMVEPGFLDTLKQHLIRFGVKPQLLTLEVTESLLIDDIGYMVSLLNKIRGLGIQIALDDFGTGYSSLSRLSNLPIQELKIDKSFVDDMLRSDTSRVMVCNIIEIGKNLGIRSLAEGVETREQLDLLRSFGCELFQGYYYAKPLQQSELGAWLAEHPEALEPTLWENLVEDSIS